MKFESKKYYTMQLEGSLISMHAIRTIFFLIKYEIHFSLV